MSEGDRAMGRTDEKRGSEGVYAVREDDRGRLIYMHRMILGIDPDDTERIVEHKNGRTLDNRRANLRIVGEGD